MSAPRYNIILFAISVSKITDDCGSLTTF